MLTVHPDGEAAEVGSLFCKEYMAHIAKISVVECQERRSSSLISVRAEQHACVKTVSFSQRRSPVFGQGHVCGVENTECQQECCLLSSLQVGPRVCPVAHSQRQGETSSQAPAQMCKNEWDERLRSLTRGEKLKIQTHILPLLFPLSLCFNSILYLKQCSQPAM